MTMSMKRLSVLIASVIGWLAVTGFVFSCLTALVSGKVQSWTALVLVLAACALAFWSFHGAWRKSRAAGAVSLADLYQDLAFRFCLTPLLTMAAVMLVTMALVR